LASISVADGSSAGSGSAKAELITVDVDGNRLYMLAIRIENNDRGQDNIPWYFEEFCLLSCTGNMGALLIALSNGLLSALSIANLGLISSMVGFLHDQKGTFASPSEVMYC
jgi:hypothetical protein